MKMNPVYKRELKVGSRSIRMAVILLAFNGILSAVASSICTLQWNR